MATFLIVIAGMGSAKTFYELLGIRPLNLEDALAADLSDMFVDHPDVAPYGAIPVDSHVFDPLPGRTADLNRQKKADLSDIDDSQKIHKNFQKQSRNAQK